MTMEILAATGVTIFIIALVTALYLSIR